MENIGINFSCYNSGDIVTVRALADVYYYHKDDDGVEDVEYSLKDIEIERMDGTIIKVDEEELSSLLSTHDQNHIEFYVLEECRFGV